VTWILDAVVINDLIFCRVLDATNDSCCEIGREPEVLEVVERDAGKTLALVVDQLNLCEGQ
jgi:hypothetical protein